MNAPKTRRRRSDRPKRIGSWIIRGFLGSGGNANVYKAVHEDSGDRVALKVIKTQVAGREPYLRFTQEVGFLQNLTIEDGVLPLLDANVPPNPTQDNQAWLAMPVANPIKKALSGKPLETVVGAIGMIADTLAQLADRYSNFAHRDIKPGNLYYYDNRWLVGDFGLIGLPDIDELSRRGRPFGPVHYTAYELMINPAIQDARPADVYSIGKTLWVLATEQTYPPHGYQPSGVTGFGIADMRPHPRAAELDRLVDAMTRLAPEQRPSMAQVATDLRQWFELSETVPPMELGDLQSRIRARLQSELAAQDLQDQRSRQAAVAFDKLSGLFNSINEALQAAHPRAVINDSDSEIGDFLKLPPGFGRPRTVSQRYICSKIEIAPGPNTLKLRVGSGIELIEDGTLIVHAIIICGIPGINPANYLWLSTPPRSAPVGSLEAERLIELTAQELGTHLEAGLEAFLAGLG